jgi:hypothetical protein
MSVGDTKFGLGTDLELQTNPNGSPAYPNSQKLSSSYIFGPVSSPETNVSCLFNGYLN